MNKNIHNYLLGDFKYNIFNKIGTIINFVKRMEDGSKLSMFLYFDHSTGRIERYLINSPQYYTFLIKFLEPLFIYK